MQFEKPSFLHLVGMILLLVLPATFGTVERLEAQGGQAPPPRMIGSLQVDTITQAPLQLLRSVALDATPQQVFHYVSDHQNWSGFSSSIASVDVAGDGRRGSTRTFSMVDGATVSERIVAFDEPSRSGAGLFAYSVNADNPFGIENHLGVLELRPADGGGTVLTYHQIFDHPDPQMMQGTAGKGTDEIVASILYAFGGEKRGASHGTQDIVIEQRRVVDASSERAWEVLADQFGDVSAWSSVISHSTLTGRRGTSLKGAVRSCEVPGTPGFKEFVVAYDKNAMMLAYQVQEGLPPFVQRALNTWRIQPLSANRAVVSMRLELAIAPGTPGMASGMAKGQFTQLTDITADELVHFVETGRPHPRKIAATNARKSMDSR
ncbi:MAG: SRPBCC family protein [Acidobacteriota bacterium]